MSKKLMTVIAALGLTLAFSGTASAAQYTVPVWPSSNLNNCFVPDTSGKQIGIATVTSEGDNVKVVISKSSVIISQMRVQENYSPAPTTGCGWTPWATPTRTGRAYRITTDLGAFGYQYPRQISLKGSNGESFGSSEFPRAKHPWEQ